MTGSRRVLFALVLVACNTGRDAALQELKSADPARRAAAAERLAGVGDDGALPALRRALGDRDPEVRRAAIASLAALSDRGALDPIIERLDDGSTPVRLAAVRALADLCEGAARRPRGKARDALVDRSLTDPEMPVRRAAQRSLEALGLPRAGQVRALADRRRAELRKRMRNGGEEGIVAARLLLEDDDASAAEVLLQAVTEGALDPADRLSVLRSLGGASLTDRTRSKVVALEPAAAAAFFEGLAASLVPDRERRLRSALTDPESPPAVRRAAARGLESERLDAMTLQALCARLGDEDREVASLAARAVATSRNRCDASIEPDRAPLAVVAWAAHWNPGLVPRLAARLAGEPGSPDAWEAASRLDDGAAALRTALSEVARREVDAWKDASVRWIPARTWTSMAPGDDEEAPPAGAPGAPRRGEEALAELLRRFPPRDVEDEIWPSRGDPARVQAAIAAAARSDARDPQGREAALGRARELASSAEAVLRAAAALTIAIVAERGAVTIPESLATDPEPSVRVEAAAVAVAERSSAWVELLIKDPDEPVRRAVARALAARPFPIAAASLRDLVRRDGTVESVRALARCLGAEARTDLTDLLRRDEATVGPELRVAILESLFDRRDVALVGTALDSGDPAVRAAAVAALCRLGGTDSRRLLRDHEEDFDASVRRAIRGCAGESR